MSACVKRVSVRFGALPSHVMPQSVRPGSSTAYNEIRRPCGIVGAASRRQQAAQLWRSAFWRSLRSPSAVVARSSDDNVGSSVAMKTSPDSNGEREGGHDVRLATSGELAGTSAASPEPGSGAERQGDRPKPVIAHRWKVVAMMAVAFILCNMDKVNMSVAVIPMAKELGWSATDRGLVSSAFFWGYTLTQVPGGYISTKLGGAKVLMGGVFLWSLGTIIAPPCAHAGLLALCASRMLVGLGEGFAPSAVTSVMARLVPPTERARAVTTVFGGLDVGSAVGLLICGPLIKMYGWPSVFYLFGLLGIVWCALFPMVKPDRRPDEAADRAAQASAPSSATNGATPEKSQEKMPWGKFMTSSAVWAIITAHFCFNYGYYTLLAWLPSYFELALGLNVEKSSLLTLIPYIAMTCMTPFVGPTADGLVKSGSSFWNTTRVRKLCQGISFLFPAMCMVVCAALTPAAGTVVTGPAIFLLVGVMSLAFAFSAWARGGLYCNHQDLSPKYASALLGITNTAGALPGVLGVTSAGFLLDRTGSWALAVFLPTAACQLFGLVVYLLFASGERQGWD